MKRIQVIELTMESFAPFGRLIKPREGRVTKAGENWSCCSPVDFVLPRGSMGIGVVSSLEVPAQIRCMERHVSREEVLWTAADDLIMLVDLPLYLGDDGGAPEADRVKAFVIRAGQVIVINRGTWHSPAFAVSGQAQYYFMVELGKDLVDQDEDPWIPFREGKAVSVEYQ